MPERTRVTFKDSSPHHTTGKHTEGFTNTQEVLSVTKLPLPGSKKTGSWEGDPTKAKHMVWDLALTSPVNSIFPSLTH